MHLTMIVQGIYFISIYIYIYIFLLFALPIVVAVHLHFNAILLFPYTLYLRFTLPGSAQYVCSFSVLIDDPWVESFACIYHSFSLVFMIKLISLGLRVSSLLKVIDSTVKDGGGMGKREYGS